jgi:galactose mutarotase-like enzyme
MLTSPTFYTITNAAFEAVISSHGAELKSLIDKAINEELIWCGDPSIWQGTAPVLFPIIGRLKQDQFQHNGQTYQLTKHGFARDAEFKLVIDEPEQKSFLLSSSPHTREYYPFDFELEVFFSLNESGLTVRYEVRNKTDDEMLFTLGSHPAFALTMGENGLGDYTIEFESSEQLDRHYLDNGLLATSPITNYLNNSNTIQLSAELFNDDALIFKNIKSRRVSIVHKQAGKTVTLGLDDAPHLGIWSKPGAEFVCLEPWFSHDDATDSDGLLINKPGMLSLSPQGIFSTSYSITR